MAKKVLTDEEAVYAAVGRALTTWGGVEDSMGQIYCAAMNPRNFRPSERAYWAVASFDGRLKMTGRAIEERRGFGNKVLKAWMPIHTDLGKQNTIRNKLAHGSVVNAGKWQGILAKKDWFLAPYYHSKKRPEQNDRLRKTPPRPSADSLFGIDISSYSWDDRPKERLNKTQLNRITAGFESLKARLDEFYFVVERQACIEEGVPLAGDPKNQRLHTILSGLPPVGSLPQLPQLPRLPEGGRKK